MADFLVIDRRVAGPGKAAIRRVDPHEAPLSREQPLALTGHTVVLGLTPHSVFLLEGLARIYQKNLKAFRAAVLGPTPQVPAYLHSPLLRAVQSAEEVARLLEGEKVAPPGRCDDAAVLLYH